MATPTIYSWAEIEKHNVSSDCWVVVRGKVYDITSWVPKHPGGVDALALNGGKDATILFESYHPLRYSEKLKSYLIGEAEHDPSKPTFPEMGEFYRTLKLKIEEYFHDKKLSPRHSPEMLFRCILTVLGVFYLQYLSLTVENRAWAYLIAILIGMNNALVGFMPLHEGSHFSLTRNPWIWRIMGAANDFVLGGSYYTWMHQHFLGHHPYTNVSTEDEHPESLDPDVVTGDPDVRRIKPSQKWYNYYRYQAIYVPMLYSLLALKFRFNDVYMVCVTKKNGMIKMNPMDSWHQFAFWGGKIFFVFFRILIPAYILSWKEATTLFLISDLIFGLTLALTFQVNHVIPQAKWPKVDKKTGRVDMDWAEMQVRTSLDYAHGSWLSTLLSGGLNHQVIHHLFPYISQIFYPDIAPIVKEHCKKYDIEYNLLPSFPAALKNHIDYLAQMGTPHFDF